MGKYFKRAYQADGLYSENLRNQVVHSADASATYEFTQDFIQNGQVVIPKGTRITGTPNSDNEIIYQNIPVDVSAYLKLVSDSSTPAPTGVLKIFSDLTSGVNKAADTVQHVKDTLGGLQGSGTPSSSSGGAGASKTSGISPLGWAGIAVAILALGYGAYYLATKKKK